MVYSNVQELALPEGEQTVIKGIRVDDIPPIDDNEGNNVQPPSMIYLNDDDNKGYTVYLAPHISYEDASRYFDGIVETRDGKDYLVALGKLESRI